MICSIVVALILVVFIGVFIAVKEKQSEINTQKEIYSKIESSIKDKQYIQAKVHKDELNARFPKAELTLKANKDFKNLNELAENEKKEKEEEVKAQAAQLEKERQTAEEKNKEQQQKRDEQYDEIVRSYNIVLSRNNFKDLYSGVEVKTGLVIMQVTDYWNLASKDLKTAFIEMTVKSWAGMHGARKMPFKYEDWRFQYRHNLSNRQVATWDSTWGTSIKD